MRLLKFIVALTIATVSATPLAKAQELSPRTTLPISFDRSIDAAHAQVGAAIAARTTQQVRLNNGAVVPAGAQVIGHIVTASAFAFDSAPYAKQKQSSLTVRFESVEAKGRHLPLHVYVRALADPLTAQAAVAPNLYDNVNTVRRIGGDLETPSQDEVLSPEGDVVAYRHHGGVYAHLVAGSTCDASDVEESMGLFSASACGLYGFADTALTQTGQRGHPSTLTLVSTRRSPKIWPHSVALLEVLSTSSTEAAQ